MSDEIKVTVIKYPDRENLVLRYKDPMTGKYPTKSAKTTNEREALKAAGKWQDELREGRHHAPSRLTWAEFRERYEKEVLPNLADRTGDKVNGVFDLLEEIVSPSHVRDLTSARLSFFQSKLRVGRADSTVRSCLAHLAAALKWGHRIGLIPVLPTIERPKRGKSSQVMKGRPITGEEFDRMLAKVPAVVGDKRAEPWRRYLRGLWTSGLRLGESLELFWDRDDKLCVDLSGKRPMLRIPGALEKGNRDRMLPIAPEFAELLLATPDAERTGQVFKLPAEKVFGPRLCDSTVCRTVSEIGEKAGIKVATDQRGKVKCASAHDLRRSFGERWATRVMPPVLQQLMRHESIETTMRFYVGRNAQSTADVLWEAHEKAVSGNKSGNTAQNEVSTT